MEEKLPGTSLLDVIRYFLFVSTFEVVLTFDVVLTFEAGVNILQNYGRLFPNGVFSDTNFSPELCVIRDIFYN